MSELPRLQPSTALESHFEFRETPFGVTPDPRFFYDHPLYSEGLAVLVHGIESKKGFMLVTGEVGTGKTILLRKLMITIEMIRSAEAQILFQIARSETRLQSRHS